MLTGTRGNRCNCLQRESMVLSKFTRGSSSFLYFSSFSLFLSLFNACTNTPIGTHDHQSRKETRLATWFARTYHALTYRTLLLLVSPRQSEKRTILFSSFRMQLNFDTSPFEWRASLFLHQFANRPCLLSSILCHISIYRCTETMIGYSDWRTGCNRLFIVKLLLFLDKKISK